jgi:hypothetical protein
MSSSGKSFAIILILMIAFSGPSLLMIRPAYAQNSTNPINSPTASPISPPTPSVPEFTAKFVDFSYYVPTTTSIDPYTGQNITNQGYYVENRTIELSINNQPFSSYYGIYPDYFYYFVQEKGHFSENWTEINGPNSGFLLKSSSDYTIVYYSLEGGAPFWNGISSGQVDFQVEAAVGGIYRISPQFASGYEFEGVTSGWSNTQTVAIPASSTSASSSPASTSTPTVPELSWLVIVTLLLFILSIAVIVRHRKTANKNNRLFLMKFPVGMFDDFLTLC